jgi:hypothetical protein
MHGFTDIKRGLSRQPQKTITSEKNATSRSPYLEGITTPTEKKNPPSQTRNAKPWTFLVYIAANNNLHTFALQNMRQMVRVGSNDNINIVVQFDGIGERKIKRYLVEDGQAKLLDSLDPEANTISGTPHSLYQFIKWGYQNFPAEHIAIDLWNHGSGIKDPSIWGKFLMSHRDGLFAINTDSNLLELNRRMQVNPDESDYEAAFNLETRTLFADLSLALMKKRGIAFNDAEEVYIDNQQLRSVLDNICRYVLIDKQIDIVFMDACHMAMVELASEMHPYANFMVASSEVEPGSGYDYEFLLKPFFTQALTAKAFAIHAVKAYEKLYKTTHSDYTQAAVELSTFAPIEGIFAILGKIMHETLSQIESKKMFELMRTVRFSSKYTTEFYDPDYIDAGHFLTSLICKTREMLATHSGISTETRAAFEKIIKLSEECYRALTTSIIAETHGSSLPMSHGLGLFFPKRNIHSSYFKTTFDKKTSWSAFLARFLNRLKYGRIISEEEKNAA